MLRYEIRGTLLLITQYPLQHYHQIRSVFTYSRIGFDNEANRKTFTPEVVASGYDSIGEVIELTDEVLPAQIASFQGYESLLLDKCKQLGIQTKRILTSTIKPDSFKPNWDNLPEGFEWRHRQREVAELIGKTRGGIIVATPAFGKSSIIGMLPRIYPNARFLISTFRRTVLETIADQIRTFIPPGTKYFIMGNNRGVHGSIVRSSRVVLCGTKSLHKIAEHDTDFCAVIHDECHNAAADGSFKLVTAFPKAKTFGFTGSPNRSDGAQFRLQGLCGPILMTVDAQEAVEQGLIVPLRVIWCDVNLQYDPTLNCHPMYKKHRGIWFNVTRNKLIAGAARLYDADTQVLILVDTIKHALVLKDLLPEYVAVSAEHKSLNAIRGAFKKGSVKKVIATGVFKEGVDFKALRVVINATGVKSEIANIQLSGRVARTSDGKTEGIVHDFYDNWSPEFKSFSKSRKKLYESMGYLQESISPTVLFAKASEEGRENKTKK